MAERIFGILFYKEDYELWKEGLIIFFFHIMITGNPAQSLVREAVSSNGTGMERLKSRHSAV